MSNKLYVGNISFQMEENNLEETFAEFGTVNSVKIITDFETGRSKGFGFIEMSSDEEAQACIENLDGKEVGGRQLRVNIAKERTERRPSRNRY